MIGITIILSPKNGLKLSHGQAKCPDLFITSSLFLPIKRKKKGDDKTNKSSTYSPDEMGLLYLQDSECMSGRHMRGGIWLNWF